MLEVLVVSDTVGVTSFEGGRERRAALGIVRAYLPWRKRGALLLVLNVTVKTSRQGERTGQNLIDSFTQRRYVYMYMF